MTHTDREAVSDTSQFVVDRDLGLGRLDTLHGVIRFFDSPNVSEIVLEADSREFRAVQLAPQQRAWWFNGLRWMVGRVDSARTPRASEYIVQFPNGKNEAILACELRVRWALPLAQPLSLLMAGTVETRYFHSRRTTFLRAVTDQRSASRRLGGLLSSAVEIHDHQVGAARRVLSDPVPRYLLADEVGLGKTIEAGMVIRQFLLDTVGEILVIVPDQIVGQWEKELISKFRINQFPGRIRLIGYSGLQCVPRESRTLTVVDEAHRFTDNVVYGVSGERERRYEILRQISHASKALLLLSATPVRSNEDGFLGLLHLLDPANYSLTDVDGFRRKVEMRDDLAEVMTALDAEMPVRYLRDPLQQISELLPDDRIVTEASAQACALISSGRAADARDHVGRLRIHISETYRLHRRMIRNRRSAAMKGYFPVRGRALADTWQIVDPDSRRIRLLNLLEELRFELEMAGTPSAGRIFQVFVGRALAPLLSLRDLVVCLQGGKDHDLAPDEEAAVAEFRGFHIGSHIAEELDRLTNTETSNDRFTATVSWARTRVGRGKYAIACSHPNTARAMAEHLIHELGRHRVTALLESQTAGERTILAAAFERSSEKSLLVFDRSAEEGTNLQFIREVLHLDIPTTTSRVEQRLGRFDRWSEYDEPVKSVVFREADDRYEEQFGAWTTVLHEVFGVFTSSTSTLQYVLFDLERFFFDTAVASNLHDAYQVIALRADTLDDQRKKISGQDLLDSIEDRAEDEELAQQLAATDSQRNNIEPAVVGYVHEMLHFTVDYEDNHLIRFAAGRRRPPLLTEREIERLGYRNFRGAYTVDRMTAADGYGFLRWGEPLVNAFAEFAENDDRGRAFAVEIEYHTDEAGRDPIVAFCFDLKVAAARPSGDNHTFVRAVEARASRFLPTTIERVWWWAGRGPCNPQMIKFLEREGGTNLGSRPERFHLLTAHYDWSEVCRTSLANALDHVRARPELIKRLNSARERAATAQEHEDVILRARSRIGSSDSKEDRRLAEALDASLVAPTYTLDSCGVVFVSWIGPT